MSHRRAGLKGIQAKRQQKEQFTKAGEALASQQLEQMKLALATFKDNLEAFAHAHSEEIKKNAAFRSHFNYLCSQVGVDPLASNK
ncbi:Vacuolar protein sorting-associated protein SNF8, partial [Kappamyces sp. JEL0680]